MAFLFITLGVLFNLAFGREGANGAGAGNGGHVRVVFTNVEARQKVLEGLVYNRQNPKHKRDPFIEIDFKKGGDILGVYFLDLVEIAEWSDPGDEENKLQVFTGKPKEILEQKIIPLVKEKSKFGFELERINNEVLPWGQYHWKKSYSGVRISDDHGDIGPNGKDKNGNYFLTLQLGYQEKKDGLWLVKYEQRLFEWMAPNHQAAFISHEFMQNIRLKMGHEDTTHLRLINGVMYLENFKTMDPQFYRSLLAKRNFGNWDVLGTLLLQGKKVIVSNQKVYEMEVEGEIKKVESFTIEEGFSYQFVEPLSQTKYMFSAKDFVRTVDGKMLQIFRISYPDDENSIQIGDNEYFLEVVDHLEYLFRWSSSKINFFLSGHIQAVILDADSRNLHNHHNFSVNGLTHFDKEGNIVETSPSKDTIELNGLTFQGWTSGFYKNGAIKFGYLPQLSKYSDDKIGYDIGGVRVAIGHFYFPHKDSNYYKYRENFSTHFHQNGKLMAGRLMKLDDKEYYQTRKGYKCAMSGPYYQRGNKNKATLRERELTEKYAKFALYPNGNWHICLLHRGIDTNKLSIPRDRYVEFNLDGSVKREIVNPDGELAWIGQIID